MMEKAHTAYRWHFYLVIDGITPNGDIFKHPLKRDVKCSCTFGIRLKSVHRDECLHCEIHICGGYKCVMLAFLSLMGLPNVVCNQNGV